MDLRLRQAEFIVKIMFCLFQIGIRRMFISIFPSEQGLLNFYSDRIFQSIIYFRGKRRLLGAHGLLGIHLLCKIAGR